MCDDIAKQIKESETDNHPVSVIEEDEPVLNEAIQEVNSDENDDYDINETADSDIDLHLNGEN